jgi:CheY-like chemotaxis protein
MGQSMPLPVVLVVEDDFMIRMLAIEFLKDAGFGVLEASDAQEAVEMLEVHKEVQIVFTDVNQIVFTDVNMPGTADGAWLARNVIQRWPHIEVIVTSGKMSAADLDLPGRCCFVPKPYRNAELVALCRGIHH